MEMQYVQSSNILAIGFDNKNSILVIEFKDYTRYEYYDVPEYVYQDFLSAPSLGKYAHQNIYPVYRYTRVG